jgi:hypothetical protein
MELSAREILDRLREGETIELKLSENEKEREVEQIEINKMIQNLNTMKSRDKNVYMELGLHYENKVIRVQTTNTIVKIFLVKTEKKRYKIHNIIH